MANRRDLHIGLDADDRGFARAFEDAKAEAQGLDRELVKLTREQAATEKVTTRTAAAVQRYAAAEDKAALAARKMGLEVKRAAEQAEKAQVRAAAAADAAKKGLLDEAKAARIAARADDLLERAAIKAAEAQLAQAAAAEKLATEERKAAEAGDKHKASVDGMRGGLASAAVAAGSLAGPLGAAGLAAAGFAAVAAPAIKKVISAQSDLAGNWDTLDRGQKIAASSVQSLATEYKSLAKSYEPDALRVFNGAVSTSRQLLPELAKTVGATKSSVAGFATSIENTIGREVPRLAGIVRSNANPALNELGTTFDQTSTLAVSLVHDLAPMGLQFLGVANGGLRFLNVLEQINPHLIEVGATMLAVRGPASALGNLWVGGASRLGKYSKAASEAEKTTATLGKTVGSSPNLFIGAALAVSLLSYRWATANSALDNRVDAIRSEADATKNSIAVHRQAISSLENESVGWTTFTKQLHASRDERIKHASDFDPSGALRISKEISAQKKAVTNITAGEEELRRQYGLTASQADALATAAGVDMAKGITGSGKAATAARAKIDQYVASLKSASDTNRIVALSLDAAGNKALDLGTRMSALDAAFGALVGPELQAFDATTKTAGAFGQMDGALKKSHGSLSLTTAAGQAARTAFAGLLSTVEENSKAQYQLESVTLGAAKAKANLTARAKDTLPLLLAETHGNKDLANAVLDWANSQGVGKTRAEALNAVLGQGKAAFLASAHSAGLSQAAAERLWRAFNKLPVVKDTRLKNNAKAQKQAVQDYQNKINSLRGKTVDIYQVMHLTSAQAYQNKRDNFGAKADGGPIHRAHGGPVARMAGGGPSGPVVGPGSGTSDDIPVWLSNGEYVIRASQTRKHRDLLDAINGGKNGFASGGPVARYATGGAVDPVSLSDVLSRWSDAVKPASKSDVAAAKKSRATQKDQLANANAALRRAEREPAKTHRERLKRADAIAAAERRVKRERSDLADATKKLSDVEKRYQAGRQSPATQLGSALGLSIKNTAAFIANLTTLTDRGFGVLAQHLLAQGDATAEKTAADAVKMSSSKLGKLNSQVGQADKQQATLASLGSILTIKTAMKGGSVTWDQLLTATGLAPNDLAAALKLMSGDLAKSASGQALLAMMHAHGYAAGGPIVGPAGTDRVPLWGTSGEWVVPKGPAAEHRQLLAALTYGHRLPVQPAPSVPAGTARGGDGAAAHGPIQIDVHARDGQSALATAHETAHELGWALKTGGRS